MPGMFVILLLFPSILALIAIIGATRFISRSIADEFDYFMEKLNKNKKRSIMMHLSIWRVPLNFPSYPMYTIRLFHVSMHYLKRSMNRKFLQKTLKLRAPGTDQSSLSLQYFKLYFRPGRYG